MLKDIMKIILAKKDFGKSGVYLRCGAKKRSIRIGEADSIERYLAPASARTEMNCFACPHLGTGCWGPQKDIVE